MWQGSRITPDLLSEFITGHMQRAMVSEAGGECSGGSMSGIEAVAVASSREGKRAVREPDSGKRDATAAAAAAAGDGGETAKGAAAEVGTEAVAGPGATSTAGIDSSDLADSDLSSRNLSPYLWAAVACTLFFVTATVEAQGAGELPALHQVSHSVWIHE